MEVLKFWSVDDFEISSYKYPLRDRVNQTYRTSGGDNTGLCTYTYNELGFRGDSFNKEGFKVMSLGCSITEGVGLNNNETWPAQFCSHIKNSVNLNFGFCGRSNDFIARCLLSYYDLIQPDLVLIMYTYTARREYYTENGGIEPFIPGNAWGFMEETTDGQNIQESMTVINNDNQDFINWYKNHLLIKYFLESKNINWVWNGCNISNDYMEKNRFDGQYNSYLDYGSDKSHPGPNHNKKYAEDLYDFIITNFPNYLPK